MIPLYHRFQECTEGFLQPLIDTCRIQSSVIPLSEMATWQTTEDGALENTFFRLEGRRTTLDLGSGRTAPSTWDQPIYKQGSGNLVLVVDEENNLLVRAVFEPGNATRGYHDHGLLLCTSVKYSPGNLARQREQGKTPPFSELVDHPDANILVTCPTPGDGARADKQNTHQLVRAPRKLLTELYEKLDPITQRQYTLVDKEVFLEAYHRGLVGEHLRDLASLLLFL